MPNYKVTVSKSFYCAFRCIDCHEMNVTKGVFKTDNSGGDFDRRRAAGLAQLNMMARLPAFYQKVNDEHNTAYLHANSTCSKCGKEQEWGQDRKGMKWSVSILVMIILFIALRYVIVPTGDLTGIIIGSIVTGLFFWPLSDIIVEEICGKMIKKKLDAYPEPECRPYVGDMNSIVIDNKTKSDDPRIKAILSEQMKDIEEKKREETDRNYWYCSCGQRNPISKAFCSCGHVRNNE